MRLKALAAALLWVLAACNLSDQPRQTTPTIAIPTRAVTEEADGPTPLPGVDSATLDPEALPSRTPLGNAPPTTVNNPGALPVPTSETGETAIINSPANGASIPAGTVEVSGVVSGLARDEFTLAIVAPNNVPVNSQLITLQNPNQVRDVPWSAAMTVTRYTGPAEIQIIAQNPEGENILLARAAITIQPGSGPAPASGSTTSPQVRISSPPPNATFSGSTIQVSGTAGGIQDNRFMLELVTDDGTVITSQTVTLTNPDYTNIVPWAASLGSGGYSGPVEIRARVGGETVGSVRLSIQ